MPDPGLVLVRGPDRSGFQDERKGWIMTVKLTDAQLVMLSAAAQRENLCLTAPDKMKGAGLSKVSEKLVEARPGPRGSSQGGDARLAPRRRRAELRAQTDGGRVESHRRRRRIGKGDRAKGSAATKTAAYSSHEQSLGS